MSQLLNKLRIITLFFVFGSYSHSQTVYSIYKNDSLSDYFIGEGYFDGVTHYSAKSLKDSLPDGIYLFYNVDRKDSLSAEKKMIIRAEYKQGKKNGLFENHIYFFNSKKVNVDYVSTWSCTFKNGLKHGVEESYVYFYDKKIYASDFYCEYLLGKKHGLCILFYNASPYKVSFYDEGILISENIIPLKE